MMHIIQEGNDNEKVGRAQLQARQFARVLGRFEGTGLMEGACAHPSGYLLWNPAKEWKVNFSTVEFLEVSPIGRRLIPS